MKVTALLSLALLLGACEASTPPEPQARALVTITRPQRGSVPDWLTAYGSATPSQMGTMTLSLNQPGQVARLLVTTGAKVDAGQPILVFTVSPTARTGYEQAATQLRVAREQRDTTRHLLAQQLATNDQMAQAEKAVADAETALAALDKEGAGSTTQTIRAPFAGIVTTIPVAQGDRMQPGAALATVAHRGGIIVTVGVPTERVGNIAVGQRARIHPLDGGGSIEGRVVRIGSAVDPQTRLINVDVSFPAGALIAGASARVDIATALRSGWLVPHQAVVVADGVPHLFQIVDGKAMAVPVTIMVPDSAADLVAGVIDPARPVIVDGAYQVAAGDAVRTR